jgi:hypothetical protein
LAGRGLAAGAADRFRLGYVDPSEADPKRYWHRLAIPYLTPTGVVQIRYRCLLPHHGKDQDDGGCPKFLGEAGAPVTLYNAQAALHARGPLILCEGEPDVWAVETIAGLPAVGVPGVRAWDAHPYWARCFVGHQLILASDGDEAGDKLAATVAKALPDTKIVRMPDGDDASSVLARSPAEFLHRCGLAHPDQRPAPA